MKWKIWLIAFLILAIAGFLFFTGEGKQYIDFLATSAGRFFATYGLNLSIFGSSGKYFNMELEVDKESFKQVSFDVSDSTIISRGVCSSDIKIENIILDKSSKNCYIIISNSTGKAHFTVANTLSLSLNSESIRIDSENYLPSNSRFNVNLEILPTSLYLTNTKNNKITLNVLYGELKKLRDEGGVDILKNLYNETIEINNFIGSIELRDNVYILRGISNQIKGENFNWYG